MILYYKSTINRHEQSRPLILYYNQQLTDVISLYQLYCKSTVNKHDQSRVMILYYKSTINRNYQSRVMILYCKLTVNKHDQSISIILFCKSTIKKVFHWSNQTLLQYNNNTIFFRINGDCNHSICLGAFKNLNMALLFNRFIID